MAVVLKHAMHALAAIKKIGVPQAQYDWLAQSPIEVKLTSDKFVFLLPNPDNADKPLWSWEVPITLTQLQALHKGHLAHKDKWQLSTKLSQAIWHADTDWKVAEPVGEPNPKVDLAETLKDAGYNPANADAVQASGELGKLGKLPPLDPGILQAGAMKPDLGGWGTFDLSQLKVATPAKLRHATMMYQPVSGTSPGSRYFVVALNKDIRVAARLQGKGLSIRVEGPDFGNYKAALSACGFKVIEAYGYASMHLTVEDSLAARTVGAVLMALGVEFDTPLPNIKHIRGG